MKRIIGYLKDERGIETLEWIAIGALILGVAFVVYPVPCSRPWSPWSALSRPR
jgi:hypothetical protein